MKLFPMNHAVVREIRNTHDLLKNQKLIGSGQFSGVFTSSNEDTVLKLSIDRASYVFNTHLRTAESNKHLPRVVFNHGQIGTFKTNENARKTKLSNPKIIEVPIYLYEVEKLYAVDGENIKIARSLCQKWRKKELSLYQKHDDETLFMRHLKILNAIEQEKLIEPSAFNALAEAIYFTDEFKDSFIDLHSKNVMQRKDKTLVFSDLIGDTNLYNNHFCAGR